jgi:tryptophan synthase beta chain
MRIDLPTAEMPRQWYNVIPDLPGPPAPPIHPGTMQPAGPDDLAPVFPMNLIEQEVCGEPWVDIPEPVLDAYAQYRPSPLYRAERWEKALGTPAHIYYKWEGVSPPGSHKPNTAIAQAYYNKEFGIKRITTETGAGQWGSALSYACCLFGLECRVFMVRVSYNQKPYRRVLMETWGATCYPSPSDQTGFGRTLLAQQADHPGSLGIAISEALEDSVPDPEARYSLGSVLNHVLLHQTINGLECKKQFALAGEEPEVIIGCIGGGSNFAGHFFPFVPDKAQGKDIRFIAVEPESCPTTTRGPYRYDFGDTAQTTPLLKMHTLGHDFVPPGIHAGGLRYHGMAPLVSQLIAAGVVESVSVPQTKCFESAIGFARAEGFVVAPETSHAVYVTEQEALKAKEEGVERVICFNNSGHGHFDLGAYQAYLAGELVDYEYPKDDIDRSLANVPVVAD